MSLECLTDPFSRYVRGSSQDYDDWAALADDPTWSHTEMMHYMRKHQTLEPIDDSITEVGGLSHKLLSEVSSWDTDKLSSVALCRM